MSNYLFTLWFVYVERGAATLYIMGYPYIICDMSPINQFLHGMNSTSEWSRVAGFKVIYEALYFIMLYFGWVLLNIFTIVFYTDMQLIFLLMLCRSIFLKILDIIFVCQRANIVSISALPIQMIMVHLKPMPRHWPWIALQEVLEECLHGLQISLLLILCITRYKHLQLGPKVCIHPCLCLC